MLKRIALCTIQISDVISLYQLGTVDLKWQSQTITPLKSEMKLDYNEDEEQNTGDKQCMDVMQ